MSELANQTGKAFMGGEAFVSGTASHDHSVETSSGVASLDSSVMQQTKSEIRSLASEIAQLSHSQFAPEEYFEGFLPRLCVAMGAKAAAVWRVPRENSMQLIAGHGLPNQLLLEPSCVPEAYPQPSVPHQRILACVVAEGQPILVPPGSVKLEADRPTNPLADALIVIPVRIQDDVEYLLEVVQRPTGGPAAQRGYLRFVAQMADLMADFLRRYQLRQLTDDRQRVRQLEHWLLTIAQSPSKLRDQLAADALRSLLDAERVLLLTVFRRSKVFAVSGTRTFDARSEIALAAGTLVRRLKNLQVGSDAPTMRAGWLHASERRQAAVNEKDSPLRLETDALCGALGCRTLLLLPMNSQATSLAIVAYVERPAGPARELSTASAFSWHDSSPGELSDACMLAGSIGTLISRGPTSGGLTWLLAGTGWGAALQTNRRQLLQIWLMRVAVAGLLIAIGLFPVTQQISATAVLQSTNKQMYYAPAAGIVTSVSAGEGEAIGAKQTLLQITSHELETTAQSLKLELRKTEGQLEEKSSLLNRGDNLKPLEKDHLEFELRELETAANSIRFELTDTLAQLAELTLTARRPGIVSTWDVENRLLNHPVQAGQLLLSTFDPDGKWRLELSIPDHRAGIVAKAMSESPAGAVLVRFSLASHPDQLLEAYATKMAPQVTALPGTADSAMTRVVRSAAIIQDTSLLPLKKDGAIARATLECGQVPLAWLILRDAYWVVSSRLRMLW